MNDRKKTFLWLSAVAVGILTAACGLNQPTRFRMSFLPPAPRGVAIGLNLDTPPDAPPNPYVEDIPAFLLAPPQLPSRKTRGDELARRAERRFQAGKRLYQANDIPGARREFDAAIDLMLDASDQNPADRQDFDRRMDEMVESIHRFDLTGMGASATLEEGKFENAPLEDILRMTFPIDPKLKDKVAGQVAATLSELPLSVNDAVLGYINFFSNRGRKTLTAGLQRSGRYRPMVLRILDEEGLPQELIHLAQAESGFIPRAVSRKAAGGMWQFLVWRGQQYGLNKTTYFDERMDPEKATRAAARHLRDLYQEFGDWYLAIAAYNCGPGVVERAVERTGYADFFELRSRGVLPLETTNYVPIILAMTIMEKNAAEYGLEGITLDPPIEYDTVEINAPTSLALVSDITGTPLPELASLNPSLLRPVAPDHYLLHTPKGTGTQLTAELQLVPSEHRNGWRLHHVGLGETLASIGRRYGTAPADIVAANRLQQPEAVEGDRLLIPAFQRAEAPAKHASAVAAPRRASAVHRAKPTTAPMKSTAVGGAARPETVALARTSAR